MEYVDIVDDSGQPTGVVKSKEEAHRDEDRHPGAHVWIVNSKGDVLFQKRSEANRLWPGRWDLSAAGHMSAGEAPLQTAVREAREEIGLSLEERQLSHLFNLAQTTPMTDGRPHKAWDTVYLAEMELEIKDLKLQEEEVSEAKLIPYREFEASLGKDSSAFVPRKEEYSKLLEELHRRYP